MEDLLRKSLRCYHWVWFALTVKFGLDLFGIWIKKKRASTVKLEAKDAKRQ
jgi:hypothetical protein